MTAALLAANAALVLALLVVLWLVSVRKRDASIVDPWWSMLFLLITANTITQTGFTPGKTLLLVLVAAWALRLWLHLLVRARGQAEDPRYAAFRERFGPERYWWFSFFQVFLLQGCLALFVSAPLQLAGAAPWPDGLTLLDGVGALIFGLGFGFEVVADRQLDAFRRDPSRRGQVLDTGLWRFSRHPNYFGEALLWWGFGLCALDQPLGWVALAGPLLMTFLLVRVSGVSLLDAHLRSTRPGYADYIERTPGFVPWRPRR